MQTIKCKIITFNTHVFFGKTNTNEEHKTMHCIALKDIDALYRVIFAQKKSCQINEKQFKIDGKFSQMMKIFVTNFALLTNDVSFRAI